MLNEIKLCMSTIMEVDYQAESESDSQTATSKDHHQASLHTQQRATLPFKLQGDQSCKLWHTHPSADPGVP